jgi:Family of unknown function (DUF6221)
MATEWTTLVDFLLARIAEDEAAAYGDIALRVVADCEAMRRVVELHQPFHYGGGSRGGAVCCWTCGRGFPFPCPTLGVLASPYADHPDFRGEWRTLTPPQVVIPRARNGRRAPR